MELVGLRLSFAGGLFLGLLALSVGAGKGVDGIVARNLHRLGFRVHPKPLPVSGGQPGFKPGFAPGAGVVSLVLQPDLPGASDPGPFHGGGVSMHTLACHLAALPKKGIVCCQLNFIGGLAQSAGALPGQKQLPAVYAQRSSQVIGSEFGCLHGSAVLSLSNYPYYKG